MSDLDPRNETKLWAAFPPAQHQVYPLNRILTYRNAMDEIADEAVQLGLEAQGVQDALGTVALVLLRDRALRHAPKEDLIEAMGGADLGPRTFRWAVRTGLITEIQPFLYGFANHRIQDYLAARHLALYPDQSPWWRTRWHEAGWEEVVPLMVAYTASIMDKPDLAEDLILGISRGPLWDDQLHLGRLIQGLCLCEDVPLPPRHPHPIWQELVPPLAELWHPRAPEQLQMWLCAIFSGLCRIAGPAGAFASRLLLENLDSTLIDTREAIAACQKQARKQSIPPAVLEQWLWEVFTNEEAPASLWEEGNGADGPKCAAQLWASRRCLETKLVALAHTNRHTPATLQALEERLAEGGALHALLIRALGQAGQIRAEGERLVLRALNQEAPLQKPWWDLRTVAIDALGADGPWGEDILNTLADLITNPLVHPETRGAAAAAAGTTSRAVTNKILLSLQSILDDPDEEVSLLESASQALGVLLQESRIPKWVDEALASPDPVRGGVAAMVAARLQLKDDRIPRRLLEAVTHLLTEAPLIPSSESGPRPKEEKRKQGTPWTMDDLLDEDDEGAGLMAEVLAELAESQEQAREVLLYAVTRTQRDSLEGAVMCLTLLCFRQLDHESEEGLPASLARRLPSPWKNAVVEAVLQALQDAEDPIWSELAWVAAVLGRGREDVNGTLRDQIRRTKEDPEKRAELAAILAAGRDLSPDVLAFLERCLDDHEQGVVLAGVEALSELPKVATFRDESPGPKLVQRILDLVNHPDWELASAAYSTLFHLARLPAARKD